MANMNGNDSTMLNPEKNICDILKVIKNEEKTADSSHTAYKTKRDSKEIARGYKICCLDKAEESYDVYQDLMSCIVLKNYKKTEIIQKNVDDYCKKDDELEKLINESSKLINELRVKINEANDAACAMANCIKNCIPEPKNGGERKGAKGLRDIKEVYKLLSDITTKTSTLASKGQNAFNSTVNVAGIQTFINTCGLKSFAANLIDSMKAFKDFITENIKTTEKDVATFRDELNVVVEELAEVTCALYMEGTKEKGLYATRKFICEGECKDGLLDLSCDCEENDNCDDDDHYDSKNMKQQTVDKD
ncbi:hypothetical protein [Aquimarina mytili]|uniref:Uncharacterized protein n=1 Tax=Aquimarina mytili TaxID=874423 RepID=A0A936ZR31_9FLAO|nr:hypothetical protein [Aquimarina mytili]MBL0683852.1 hypothetical protein [Aquimarina mytili]